MFVREMEEIFIEKKICSQILMIGVDYKHCLGGMASVVQYYEPHFEKLRYVATFRYANKGLRLFYFLYAVCKIIFLLLLDRRIKIVHIHTAADGSFVRASIIIFICSFFKKKVLLHCHASRFKDFYLESNRKEWIIRTIQKVERLIVLSESWKEWFISIGIDKSRIFVLNNITSYPQIKDFPTDGKMHLLFLGLLGKRKGIFDILKAIEKNKSFFRERLVFKIGGNTHEKELLEKIKEYGVGDFVFFEGWVSGEKKIDLLNWADVYILPSYNEGLPIGILEAMSYGCVVITTPVGGIPDVVKDGESGVLVPPGDVNAIGNAITEMLDVENRRKILCNSRDVIKDYLPNKVINSLSELYKMII